MEHSSDQASSTGSSTSKQLSSGGKWVRFDDSCSVQTTISDPSSDQNAHVVYETNPRSPPVHKIRPTRYSPSAPLARGESSPAQIEVNLQESSLSRNIILDPQKIQNGSSIDELENGKILCQILPENNRCAWLSAPSFNPYKMPKSLVSDKLAMPVEEYVTSMEMLTNDFRFCCYSVCYRRLIVIWLIIGLIVLVGILASGLKGFLVFGIVLIWLFLVGLGIIGCLLIKKQINKGLQYAVMCVNKILVRHNLLIGAEDRGRLSCHKVSREIVRYLDTEDQQRALANKYPREIAVDASIHQGRRYLSDRPYTTEERAELLVLRYSQSYVKQLVRRLLNFPTRPLEGVSEFTPLHSRRVHCLCQFLWANHFNKKPTPWYRRFF